VQKKKYLIGDAARLAVLAVQLDDDWKMMDGRGVSFGKRPPVSRWNVRIFISKKNGAEDPSTCLHECGYCGAVYEGFRPPSIIASLKRSVYRCTICAECDGIMWSHKMRGVILDQD